MLRAVVLYMLGVLAVQLYGGMCVEGAAEDEVGAAGREGGVERGGSALYCR